MGTRHAAVAAVVAATVSWQRWSWAEASGVCGAPGSHVGSTVETESALSTVVDAYSTDGIAGYTTWRVAVKLLSSAQNIYTIYGDSRPMRIPAALQQDAPFGVDIGGSNPQFFPIAPDCEFDSWLTVGPTDGNGNGAVSAIGIDFTSWDEMHALSVDNGAVFWMDPDRGPTAGQAGVADYDVVVAQLTMVAGTGSPMFFDAQGNSVTAKHDWEEHCIEVMVGGPNSGAGTHSQSGIPMPGPGPGTGGSSKPPSGASGTPASCPSVADGTCDEGAAEASCPVGTDTADCLGEGCLTVDTAMINTACSGGASSSSQSGSIPDQCTPACALVYKQWWQRCSPAQEVQLTDRQMGGGLSRFYDMCMEQKGGH